MPREYRYEKDRVTAGSYIYCHLKDKRIYGGKFLFDLKTKPTPLEKRCRLVA